MQAHYPHFTSAWISLIESGTTSTVEQLVRLLRLLPGHLAPIQPPPEVFGGTNFPNNQGVQVRYLIFHGECRLAELIRISSIQEANHKRWIESAQFWSQAYDHLHRVQTEADPFYTISLSFDQNDELPEGHDYQQLQDLFEKLNLVREHTEQERDRAISVMEHRLASIDRQLNPLQRDRDEVRESMGEHAWRSNPRPKRDFARAREPLEEELRALRQAIDILRGLSLSSAGAQ
jgi:hypothetical protein